MSRGIIGKIWRVLYPALVLFGTYLLVYFLAIYTYGAFFAGQYGSFESFISVYGDYVSVAALMSGGLIAYIFYRRDYPVEFRLLTDSPKYILLLIALAILLNHGLNIMMSLLNMTGIFGSAAEIQAAQMMSASGIIITTIKAVILAPLAEEITFRGLIFRRMELYTGFWPAALVSSALFGLYHLNLLQGIYAFLFGIMLCLVYKKFRNIFSTIIMHAAANAFSIIIALTGLDYPSVFIYVCVMVATLAASMVLYLAVIRRAGE